MSGSKNVDALDRYSDAEPEPNHSEHSSVPTSMAQQFSKEVHDLAPEIHDAQSFSVANKEVSDPFAFPQEGKLYSLDDQSEELPGTQSMSARPPEEMPQSYSVSDRDQFVGESGEAMITGAALSSANTAAIIGSGLGAVGGGTVGAVLGSATNNTPFTVASGVAGAAGGAALGLGSALALPAAGAGVGALVYPKNRMLGAATGSIALPLGYTVATGGLTAAALPVGILGVGALSGLLSKFIGEYFNDNKYVGMNLKSTAAKTLYGFTFPFSSLTAFALRGVGYAADTITGRRRQESLGFT